MIDRLTQALRDSNWMGLDHVKVDIIDFELVLAFLKEHEHGGASQGKNSGDKSSRSSN